MPVTISSLSEAKNTHSNYDYIISITNPLTTLQSFGPNHLHVNFIDTADPTDAEFKAMQKGVAKIHKWVKDKNLTNDNNILVHCHQGVSRSSAIAWSLLVMFGESYLDAFKNIYKARPCIWPNLAVIALMDTHLGKNGEFYQVAQVVDMELYSKSGYC